MLHSEPALLLRQVVLSRIAEAQANAMRFCFKRGAPIGAIPTNALPDIESAQKWNIFLEVLDELAKPDYKYYTVEIKIENDLKHK